jgi:hypothetical protein
MGNVRCHQITKETDKNTNACNEEAVIIARRRHAWHIEEGVRVVGSWDTSPVGYLLEAQ